VLQRYLADAGKLLEIGCGTGFVLAAIREALPNAKLYGSELFSQALAFANERAPDATLFQLDARRMPFENEFDGVCVFDVLEHIEEDELVLGQIYQSLKPGGRMIVTVPQHPWLWSEFDECACHKRRYQRAELKRKVQTAGFDVVRCTSFVTALLPIMTISRLWQRRRQPRPEPEMEFRLSALVNFAFEKILGVERFLITSGISFPAGGSLLLVAQRGDTDS